jgi:hypothetical protein
MAKSDRNRTTPKTDYDWKEGGEEWSGPWGTSAAQWYGAIYSRMHGCLPADTILEIAPGFGRWTHYLKDHCQHLYIVDPTAKCIEACRQRFGDDSGLSYHINDGRSLAMIADCSIDFVFSFDSMVHVRRDILEGYLSQLTAKLKPDGLGFIHHSNLGQYAGSAVARAPKPVRKLLTKMKVLDSDKRRAPDMTARIVSLCLRRTRPAVYFSGSRQLARAAIDRLFFIIHQERFEVGWPVAIPAKSKFHARSRTDSTMVGHLSRNDEELTNDDQITPRVIRFVSSAVEYDKFFWHGNFLLCAKLLSRISDHLMDISLKSLEEALSIRRQIAALEQRLSAALLGASPSTRRGKRRMSPQARAKIAAAMRERWAREKGRTGHTSPVKRTGGITPAGRKRLSQLMKARWAARKRSTAKK